MAEIGLSNSSRSFARRIALMAVLAVTATQARAIADTIYVGSYTLGFEQSSFQDYNPPGRYWVLGAGLGSLKSLLSARSTVGYGTVAVAVCGRLSETGHFGHLGAYTNELKVSSIMAINDLNKWNDRVGQRCPGLFSDHKV